MKIKNHAYYSKIYNSKNDSIVEIVIDTPMLHEEINKFKAAIIDTVREFSNKSKYKITITIE